MERRVFDDPDGFQQGPARQAQLAAFFGLLGLSLLAWAASCCVAIANLRGWYMELDVPALAPSAANLRLLCWALGAPYAVMAISAWLVWRQHPAAGRQRAAMSLWGWQLALGAAWPAAFFGLHLLAAALPLAIGLTACSALTVRRFARLQCRAAALLLLPYFCCTFPLLYLSAGFWWLNR